MTFLSQSLRYVPHRFMIMRRWENGVWKTAVESSLCQLVPGICMLSHTVVPAVFTEAMR